jgi:zinc finger protein
MTQDEFSIKCPACTEGIIKINKTVYDLPDKDKMLILKFECDKCSFHKNDIIPLTTNMNPGVMTLEVGSETDLKSKIYRSPMGKLEIPELELAVEPGPRADFYYTNVEGILLRFESAVSIYRNNLEEGDEQTGEIEKLLIDLQKAMEGRLNFTLIITDTQGGSYIIPHDKSKYKFEKLKKNELE